MLATAAVTWKSLNIKFTVKDWYSDRVFMLPLLMVTWEVWYIICNSLVSFCTKKPKFKCYRMIWTISTQNFELFEEKKTCQLLLTISVDAILEEEDSIAKQLFDAKLLIRRLFNDNLQDQNLYKVLWSYWMGGALPKNWWRGCMDTLNPFFNSLSPIDPLLRLALTEWPPFLIIHNQFLTIFHQMTPFFWQHFVKNFQFLSKNMSKFVFCAENVSQICLFSPFDRPFFGLLTEWPPFSEKKFLTERPLVLSCCPSTPVTSKVECPPPPLNRSLSSKYFYQHNDTEHKY